MSLQLSRLFVGIFVVIIGVLGALTLAGENAVASGLFLAFLGGGGIILFALRRWQNERPLVFLLAFTLILHICVVLFIHYAAFQPFSDGTGDYTLYQNIAEEISMRVRSGNFSISGLPVEHLYPVFIGYLYAFTAPFMVIGQLVGVLGFVLSVLFAYLIVRELEGSKVQALWAGMLVNLYPSYLFYGSLLLKESLVVPFALAGVLFGIKLLKRFSWRHFTFFYIALAGLVNMRFYVGLALIFTFVFSWFIFGRAEIRKKVGYGLLMVFLLGFTPQLSGYGYYGMDPVLKYLDPQQISFYREVAYVQTQKETAPEETQKETASEGTQRETVSQEIGKGSSIIVEVRLDNPFIFAVSYAKAFIYTALGPFPWQVEGHQRFALIETIPWYILLAFAVKGFWGMPLQQKRRAMLLVLFAAGVFAILALFLSNFGIVTRIRMPAFVVLLCLAPLAFSTVNGTKK